MEITELIDNEIERKVTKTIVALIGNTIKVGMKRRDVRDHVMISCIRTKGIEAN